MFDGQVRTMPGETFKVAIAEDAKPFTTSVYYRGIRKIQHFRFTKKSPGIVFTRVACDDPESQYNLLKRGVRANQFKADKLPQLLAPPGISAERAQYLHDEIREFVNPEFRDVLCPSPSSN